MNRIISVLVLGCLALPACSEDPTTPTPVCDLCCEFCGNLTKRDNVLFNLEQAYEQQRRDRYEELLDSDFTFFFGHQDVQNNGVPAQWDRAREIGSVTNLFDPVFVLRDRNGEPRSDAGPVENITLDLQFVEGENQWFEMAAPDQDKYPGENWFEKTVEYSLTIEAGDLTLTNAQPLFARLTVRPVAVGAETHYRIVQWRDDILDSERPENRAAKAVEQSTWGSVKAVFEYSPTPAGGS